MHMMMRIFRGPMEQQMPSPRQSLAAAFAIMMAHPTLAEAQARDEMFVRLPPSPLRESPPSVSDIARRSITEAGNEDHTGPRRDSAFGEAARRFTSGPWNGSIMIGPIKIHPGFVRTFSTRTPWAKRKRLALVFGLDLGAPQ